MRRDDATWRARAACRACSTALFFPDPHDSSYRDCLAIAKALCAGCPVLEACRAHALRHPAERGIWGGLTEQERRALRASGQSFARSAGVMLAAKDPAGPDTACREPESAA